MIPNLIEIVVRRISTDEAALPASLADDERAYASQLVAHRRSEWVAWRSVLRENAERWGVGSRALKVAYAATGEPIFEGLEGSISVTHCRGYVAVARSRGGRCGIDVERLDRNFENVESKYISATERQLAERVGQPDFRAAIWCAKEAVYKYLRREGIDFQRDMQVVDFEQGGAYLDIESFGERLRCAIFPLDGAILVATAKGEVNFELRKEF